VNGICDNLLLATLLSSKTKVFWAPAMDLDMFKNQANQGNLNLLNKWGHTVLPSPFGDLASGLVGPGRMAEPDKMYFAIRSYLLKDEFWYGKKVILTSGPTRESIDPVRFLSNGSSGKTGVALLTALVDRGAIITWVHGLSHYHLMDMENVLYKPVLTALEMRDEVMKAWSDSDIYIGAAAVSDYRPKQSFKQKNKKVQYWFRFDQIRIKSRYTIGSWR
jgi:phosphopantothenoylcysteine decarboxylase/phosphopantothenate--cysteine ligase